MATRRSGKTKALEITVNKHLRNVTALVALLASMTLPTVSHALEASALEKAELGQLNPDLRAQVEARMVNGQTVRGILEMMLLNNISLLSASNMVVAIDFDKGISVVERTNGQVRAFPFDVTMLVVKP